MGFSDPIIGGDGALVREQIKSPDYVPQTTGWQLGKDGSADLSNARFRGAVLIGPNGSPQINLATDPRYNSGGLSLKMNDAQWGDIGGLYILKVNDGTPGEFSEVQLLTPAPTAGQGVGLLDMLSQSVDGVTNLAQNRLAVVTPTGALSAYVEAVDSAVTPTARLKASLASTGADASLEVSPTLIKLSGTPAIGARGNPRIQLGGNGSPGGAYYERVNLNTAQTITNNTIFVVTGFSLAQSWNDYNTAFSGLGTWTCPEDGPYMVDYKNWYPSASWVAGSRMQMRVILNAGGAASAANSIAADDFTPTTASVAFRSLFLLRDFVKGDVLQFTTFQNTGAGISLSAGSAQHNYIAIKRLH